VVQTSIQDDPGPGAQNDSQEIPYDSLIVAAGASHAYFGHDEWQAFLRASRPSRTPSKSGRRVLLAFELAERRASAAKVTIH